jgi:hypothetical protein
MTKTRINLEVYRSGLPAEKRDRRTRPDVRDADGAQAEPAERLHPQESRFGVGNVFFGPA